MKKNVKLWFDPLVDAQVTVQVKKGELEVQPFKMPKMFERRTTVQVKQGELEVQRVPAWVGEQKHRYLAVVRMPAIGRYLVRAAAEFKDGKTGEDRQILASEEFDRETLDLPAGPEPLADISRCSGGTVFAAQGNDPKAMKTALGGSRLARVEYRRTPLWDTWVWLTAMVGLLSVEWVVRRLQNRGQTIV